MSDRNIAPGLLLAMPQLPDPNFARTVLLLVDHDPEGSWGLVLNRPTEIPIREVLDQLEVAWAGPQDTTVWQGGPVEPLRGCVLHEPVDVPIDPELRNRDLVEDVPDAVRAEDELDPIEPGDRLRSREHVHLITLNARVPLHPPIEVR